MPLNRGFRGLTRINQIRKTFDRPEKSVPGRPPSPPPRRGGGMSPRVERFAAPTPRIAQTVGYKPQRTRPGGAKQTSRNQNACSAPAGAEFFYANTTGSRSIPRLHAGCGFTRGHSPAPRRGGKDPGNPQHAFSSVEIPRSRQSLIRAHRLPIGQTPTPSLNLSICPPARTFCRTSRRFPRPRVRRFLMSRSVRFFGGICMGRS